MSREYTQDEVQKMFLDHVRSLVKYWATITPNRDGSDEGKTVTEVRLEGLAFSILAALDGCAMEIPGFTITPICPEEDQKYLQENEENWFNEEHDIGGGLHERFYRPKNETK